MNAGNIKIEFIENTARKPQGLSHPGIEQFRDNPYVSCARETGQNTNDAPDQGKRPVRMEFNARTIKREELPFADELLEVSNACLEQSKERCRKNGKAVSSDRTVRFFDRASKALKESKIRILEISDFNTTGLTGPFDDHDSVFNSLVKADGVTNKPNIDSGGSFGIGKNAVFAVSDVQTVLYSTLTKVPSNSDKPNLFACQARVQLISHELNGTPFAAEGYWGHENFYAIEDENLVPDWMVRASRGTSIFAICFREHESWAERMALSILTNFLIAVMRGDMEFEIDDGKISINRATIENLLGDDNLNDVAGTSNQTLALERARNLHECLTSGASETHVLDVEGYGKADLKILVAEGMPRSVSFVRNGMYITSNLRDFGFPLVSFPGTKEFIAILEPHAGEGGKKLSEILKRMENPEHDNFSPERLREDDEREKVLRSFAKLHREIRDKIRDAAKVAESDYANIDELARLFSADPKDGDSQDGSELDPERYEYGTSKTAKKPRKLPSSSQGNQGGAGGGGGSGKGGSGHGRGRGSGSGGSGRKGSRPFQLSEIRSTREPGGSSYTHRIYFTPLENGKCEIQIQAAGLTDSTNLNVVAVDGGTLNGGTVVMQACKDQRNNIAVMFSDDFDGPVEVLARTVVEENGK